MARFQALLTHAKTMPDGQLAADFKDCLLVEAESDHDHGILEDYYRTRAHGPRFQPKSYQHNNHALTDWDIREAGLLGTAEGRVCVVCGKPLSWDARTDAQTCSPRCRRRLRRRSEAA